MNRNAWLAMLALCAAWLAQASPAMASSQDIMDMAQNLLRDLGGANGNFFIFFRAFCILMGVTLVATGVYGMTQKRKNSIVVIIVGAVITSVPNFINIVTASVFDQQAAQSIISEYGAGSGDGKLETAAKIFVNISVFMVQVVGFCAVYRGLKTIADVAGSGQFQPTQQRTAIIFIVAGVICINIVFALSLIANTMGAEGQKYYNMIFGHIHQSTVPNVVK